MSITLADIIRIKEERGYSVSKLSEYSGVPVGTLQKLLRGESANPREATLLALEKVLYGDEALYPGKSYSYQSESATPGCVMEAALYQAKKQGEYTLEDYYALPDERRVELIDGVIYDMAAPFPLHQLIAGVVHAKILDFIEENGGNCIPFIAPTDVQLDCDNRTMVQPDVLILCDRKKLKKFGIYGAPDFVLEVLSKSTKKKDMTIKLAKYLEAGVREYWAIDPEKRLLIVYASQEDGIPHIYPLQGNIGIGIYGGRLQISLDRINRIIEEHLQMTSEEDEDAARP